MNTNTHFSFLRDPHNIDRVITVARKVEGSVITFGFAICRPDEWKTDVGKNFVDMHLQRGDRHDKAKGRLIAEGRMNNPATQAKIQVVAGEHPMTTIAKYMAVERIGMPTFVARTFKDYISHSLYRAQTKKLCAQRETSFVTTF